ncbi:MAG: protein kinase, partial [Polyangiaceae bacterium]
MPTTPEADETWPAAMTGLADAHGASATGSSPPPGPGTDRVDRYEPLRERARGGLGRVVEAQDRLLRRVVAVKELLHRDHSGEARFVREAFITARLQHPSIVPVYDAATSADGAPFYVMKLVNGRTLDELVAQRPSLRERLALLPNVIAVADAVAYAHSQGVLHRDLKGSNVIVGDFGETIVIDWGLAKRIEDADDREVTPRESPADDGLTVEGSILGTPLFMAPEQARGERVDARTDVFALGGLLYFVLAGKAPYADIELRRLLGEVRAGSATPVRAREPGVSSDLAAIVAKAMASDPARRYPTARELADDLRVYQNGGLVAAYRYKARDRLARGLRRHLGVAVATGSFLFLGAVAVAVFGLHEQGLRRAAEQARDHAAAEQARADRQSLVLLEQQGRDELEAGRPFRAAVYLSEAYGRAPDSLAVRSLLTEALRPLAAHRLALVGHTRDVPAGAYSPDGLLVATGSDDRSVRLWDARTGTMLHTIDGFQGSIEWIAFSHDGRSLVAASAGQHPRVSTWSVPGGAPLTGFDLHRAMSRVEFTPDDAALVVGDFDGYLRAYDLASGATRLEARPFRDRITSIAFRPGTSQMLLSSNDHTAAVWDWRTLKPVSTFAAFDRKVSSASYSADGRYLLLAESEHHIHVYDATKLTRLRTIHVPESAPDPDAFFSPDARLVVAGAKDGRIRVWHTSSGALLRLIDAQPAGQLYRMALRGDGNEVATMGGDGAVNLWSLDTDLDYRVLGRQPIDDTPVLTSSYIDGDRTLVLPGGDGEVRILDARTGEPLRSLSIGLEADTIAFDAHATRLATTGELPAANPPRVWDFTTGALVALLQPQAPPLTYALGATSDGTGFLTGDYVGTVREWDAATGALRGEHVVTAARLSSLSAHPDGRTIAVASEHGTVFFVDRETGKTLRTLQAHACWIQSLAFAESGRTLLTAGRQDHTVKVWREPFDAPVVLTGHTGMVLRASMSDDGRRVATVSSDGTARLWDAHTGELLRVIHGPTTTATFRPRSDDLL